MSQKQDPGLTNSELSRQLLNLAQQAHPELLAECRSIAAGDEFALTDAEITSIGNAVVSVRRASGAARLVAKELLSKLGSPPNLDLSKSASGAPRWPQGFVGSLAHDREVAVALVAPSRLLRSVGVDVEPTLPLPEHLLDLVATRSEQRQLAGSLVSARLLFCMKEAVYKATHPLDGVLLEHLDVEICLSSSTARTSSGHTLRIYTAEWPRLLALTAIVA
jgi:4'-phosphopantetheinyl transferase EntD